MLQCHIPLKRSQAAWLRKTWAKKPTRSWVCLEPSYASWIHFHYVDDTSCPRSEDAALTDKSRQVTGRTSLGTPGQLHFLNSSAKKQQ